jgi:hypothetical protein
MGIPYEIEPLVGIQIEGSTSRVVSVSFPSRSYIDKILVEQTDGDLASFTVDLFNHPVVSEDDGLQSVSGSQPGFVGNIPEACFLVGSRSSASAGRLRYLAEEVGGRGYPFFSQVRNRGAAGSPSGRDIGNTRRLYVRITVQGNGPKTFAMVIGAEVPGAE